MTFRNSKIMQKITNSYFEFFILFHEIVYFELFILSILATHLGETTANRQKHSRCMNRPPTIEYISGLFCGERKHGWTARQIEEEASDFKT